MPSNVGTAAALDAFDVNAINQMYAGRPSLPPIGPGRFFYLVPQYTSKVLAVPASLQADGIQLVLFDKLVGVTDQHFSLHDDGAGLLEIRPRHAPSKCIEVVDSTNGAAVVQRGCNNDSRQKWSVAPTAGAPWLFDIINKDSGRSAEVTNAGTANGALIRQWTYLGASHQRFSLVPIQ